MILRPTDIAQGLIRLLQHGTCPALSLYIGANIGVVGYRTDECPRTDWGDLFYVGRYTAESDARQITQDIINVQLRADYENAVATDP